MPRPQGERERSMSQLPEMPTGKSGLRRRALHVVAVALAWVLPCAVQAQAIDIHSLRPWPGSPSYLQLLQPTGGPSLAGASLIFDYADTPLVFHNGSPSRVVPVLDYLGTLNAQAWFRHRRLSAGLCIPTFPTASGPGVHLPMFFGDLSLHGDYLLVEPSTSSPGLSILGALGLPTGNHDAWISEEKPSFRAAFALGWGERIGADLNLGFATASGSEFGSIRWGERVTWGLGTRLELPNRWKLTGEAIGAILLDEPFSAYDPAELQLSLGRPVGSFAALLGAGMGLSSGPGIPEYRLIAGLQWSHGRPARARSSQALDNDFDGILDIDDPCPDQAEDPGGLMEGCPDIDRVPLHLRLIDDSGEPLSAFSIELPDSGSPLLSKGGAWARSLPPGPNELVLKADGYETSKISLNLEPGAPWRLTVLMRRPEVLPPIADPDPNAGLPDQDHDSIPDSVDRCPEQAEEWNLVDDKDGCPDGDLTLVEFLLRDPKGARIERARIAILSGPTRGDWATLGGHSNRSLPEGEYHLRVLSPGYLPMETVARIPRVRRAEQVLTLVPAYRSSKVLLRFRDAEGRPVPVELRWDNLLERRAQVPTGDHEQVMPPGDYDFRAIAPGYLTKSHFVTLFPNRTHTLDFSLVKLPDEHFNLVVPLSRPIVFEPGTAVIATESYPALWELADILRAHPEILELNLEGIVPYTANEACTPELAHRAAKSAWDYLVETAGIDPKRLTLSGRSLSVEQYRQWSHEPGEPRPALRPKVRVKIEPLPGASPSTD